MFTLGWEGTVGFQRHKMETYLCVVTFNRTENPPKSTWSNIQTELFVVNLGPQPFHRPTRIGHPLTNFTFVFLRYLGSKDNAVKRSGRKLMPPLAPWLTHDPPFILIRPKVGLSEKPKLMQRHCVMEHEIQLFPRTLVRNFTSSLKKTVAFLWPKAQCDPSMGVSIVAPKQHVL